MFLRPVPIVTVLQRVHTEFLEITATDLREIKIFKNLKKVVGILQR